MDLPRPVRYYHTPRAPNPRRTDIFFAEKGVEFERVAVDLLGGAHKQEDYLRKIGVPQVPALELADGTVLVEAPAICRYVEALCPEPNMLGRDPLGTASNPTPLSISWVLKDYADLLAKAADKSSGKSQ